MKRLGVFGGSFDPVHNGHLLPALRALETFDFEAILLVPAASPPHKQGEPLAPFVHRFAMLTLATAEHDRLLVSDIEQHRHGPTYTIDTLEELRRRWPDHRLSFLMGSDSLAQLGTWRRWTDIVALADIVVLRRPTIWGAALADATPPGLCDRVHLLRPGDPLPAGEPERRIYLLDHDPLAIAATDLRERIARGAGVRGEVPAAVERYIVKYGLYRPGRPSE